ncbi:MAG: NTP transferase domain-containing protein [Xanthomonadaceae bacterium]|nr:NTP transferase domain-containing protein [Xanthomonadaceae bacterium]
MQAVVLAAGRGSRLRELAECKPLQPLLGLPLLERNVRAAQQCGIEDIVIVTGYEHARVEEWRRRFAARHDAPAVRLVHNNEWETAENGRSLLAAAPFIQGRFLLLMGDHVYTPELLRSLCAQTPPPGGAVIAVDGMITRSDIDLNDVTRVRLAENRVEEIDKHLATFDAFDTGAFICEPDVLEQVRREVDAGRTRLSDAMQALAANGALLAHRVDGCYWQDVDTPEMYRLAEHGLLDWAGSKRNDGFVARWINRPFSKRISKWLLVRSALQPNHISLIAFAIGIVAALLLAQPHYLTLLLGGLLVQLASVVDGCDGEVARLRFESSSYGGWLDALLDRYADLAVLGALTWHLMQTQQEMAWMWLGLAAIAGSFIASYSAHKADQLSGNLGWRLGRDTRSLIVMVGAILARPDLVLWVVAIVMNAVVLYRIISLRRPYEEQERLSQEVVP